jgi:hypothetical protein
MATPITSIDSPNIVSATTTNVYNVTGSLVGQNDINYILAENKSFTGSLNLADNTVGFGYGWLVAPSGSGVVYPTLTKKDFVFYLNGVRIDDDQVLAFDVNTLGPANSQSTASFNLGYAIRSYDVVTAVGKFK